jgi:hypothetical protein
MVSIISASPAIVSSKRARCRHFGTERHAEIFAGCPEHNSAMPVLRSESNHWPPQCSPRDAGCTQRPPRPSLGKRGGVLGFFIDCHVCSSERDRTVCPLHFLTQFRGHFVRRDLSRCCERGGFAGNEIHAVLLRFACEFGKVGVGGCRIGA